MELSTIFNFMKLDGQKSYWRGQRCEVWYRKRMVCTADYTNMAWMGAQQCNCTCNRVWDQWMIFFLEQEALCTFYTLGNDLVMREKGKKKKPDKAERKRP